MIKEKRFDGRYFAVGARQPILSHALDELKTITFLTLTPESLPLACSEMLIFTQRYDEKWEANETLSLDAEARSRPRQHLTLDSGEPCYLRLPRGTILQEGDCLRSDDGTSMVRIVAKPESVFTVKATQTEDLLKAAYHLGNRHVPLEITIDYLRLSPDPVLEKMLEHMGLTVIAEVTPFFPELGAYHQGH